jgi:predicted MFS family arabinose efflux permease
MGLLTGNDEGWTSVSVVSSFILGVLLLGSFIRYSLKQTDPMINLRFFKNMIYLSFNLTGFWMSAGIFGAIFLLTLFLQLGMGYSALGAGSREMAWTGMTMIAAPIAGILIAKLGARRILVIGLLLQIVAMLYFAYLAMMYGATFSFMMMLPGMMLAGTGMGLSFTPLSHGTLSSQDEKDAGEASGVSNTFRELGGVFGIAIAGLVFQSGSAIQQPQDFADHLVPALLVCAAMISMGLISIVVVGRKRHNRAVLITETVR